MKLIYHGSPNKKPTLFIKRKSENIFFTNVYIIRSEGFKNNINICKNIFSDFLLTKRKSENIFFTNVYVI
jgi:hypothetical protein